MLLAAVEALLMETLPIFLIIGKHRMLILDAPRYQFPILLANQPTFTNTDHRVETEPLEPESDRWRDVLVNKDL